MLFMHFALPKNSMNTQPHSKDVELCAFVVIIPQNLFRRVTIIPDFRRMTAPIREWVAIVDMLLREKTYAYYHNDASQIALYSFPGTQFGNIIVLPLGGFLCMHGPDGGWPSIFYVLGMRP